LAARPALVARPGSATMALSCPFWGFSPRLTPEQELKDLKDKAGWLKEQLDAVNQRIGEIGK
jgi:hypothetical protein